MRAVLVFAALVALAGVASPAPANDASSSPTTSKGLLSAAKSAFGGGSSAGKDESNDQRSSTTSTAEQASSSTESTTSKKGLLGSAKSAVGSAADKVSDAVDTAADKVSDTVSKAGRFAVTHTTDDEVCYGVLGCFSFKSPWVTALRPVPAPSTPEEVDVKFYLYTRNQRGRYNVTSFPEVVLDGSDFQVGRPTFFVVHGFSSDGNSTWLSDLKDAVLEKVDGNVFLVDWGKGANDGTYFKVVANTRIVGAELGRLGRHLVHGLGADPGQFHFLGHSLGAQISSYAAKNITNVGRITAMDPAQPLFENLDVEVRIDPSDASFVDVIHSNAKPTIPFIGFGMLRPVGHVDFYLNGGADQPGCEVPQVDSIKTIGDLAKIPITVVGNLVACSHGRSYEYVTEAIRSPCRMWGHKINLAQQLLNLGSIGRLSILTTSGKCETGACTPIGLDTPSYPTRGTFSVGTAPDKPYCVPDTSDDGQQLDELRRLGALDGASGASNDRKANSTVSRLTGKVGSAFG